MEILTVAPVIFTKDEDWVNYRAENITIEPGAIILLPKDAVLFSPPLTVDQLDPRGSGDSSPPTPTN